MVAKEGGGVSGERWGEGIGDLTGSRCYGDAFGGGAIGGGVGLVAELGGEGAFDVDAVCGAGGGGPVELDLIADAPGGEVGNHFGKIERRGAWIAWAGTADGKGEEGCEDRAKPSVLTGMP